MKKKSENKMIRKWSADVAKRYISFLIHEDETAKEPCEVSLEVSLESGGSIVDRMLLFCPTCSNVLTVEEGTGPSCYRFACQTCPYVYNITKKVNFVT